MPHTDPMDLLELEPVGEHRYHVRNEGDPDSRDVVFGGQLLAQMIMAATRHAPGKFVKTINAIFARAGSVAADTELDVDTIHSGRAVASHTITAYQGDRLCARALVLMSAEEPDLIHHEQPAPFCPAPEACGESDPGSLVFPGGEIRIVGGVDTWSVDAPVAPPELSLWYRVASAPPAESPEARVVNQAMLAWGTDGFLIGTAMLPHPGIGQRRAHRDISTGVIDHTLTFHQPFSLGDWVLMVHESPFAGGGRTHGRCMVYDRGGRLVASYVQDNLVRSFPKDVNAEGQHRTIM